MLDRRISRRALLFTTMSLVAAWHYGCATSLAAEPAFVLETAKSKTIKTVYEFEIHLPNLAVEEWILFAAQAPNLPSQTVTKTVLSHDGEPARDHGPRNHAILRARVPATNETLKHTVSARIAVNAALYSRHLAPRKRGQTYPDVTEPSEAELERSTAETELLNFSDEKFQTWLRDEKLHRKRKEQNLDFARRTFLAITQSYEYDYAAKMDRQASHLCEANKTDCGGMCVLFIAALRANDVPARLLCGRWAKSSKPGAELNGVAYNQQHVKAEFFAERIGWVPVDLSSAVLHDESDEGLQYFGHDCGDFLTIHVDPEFEVDTVHFGRKTFAFMQGFHYWATGKGKLDGEKFTFNWQVEVVP